MKPTEAQRICIEETFGMPSAVVAGAGSGKTATLTNRIVYALEHPGLSGVDDIDRILAITYTNKAAGELKSRIRSALQEAGRQNARLAEQALKVDGAWISTIHGMCSRILKENALTLGIDPSFGILPEDLGDQLRRQAIEEALTAHADDPRVGALYGEYGRDDIVDMLCQLAALASEQGGSLDRAPSLPPRDSASSCLLDLVGYARQLYALVSDASGTTAEKWCAGTLSALEQVLDVQGADAALAPLSPETEARLLDTAPDKALLAAGKFPKVNRRLKAFKEARLEGTDLPPYLAYADCAARLRLAVACPHLDTLAFLAQDVADRFTSLKTQLGMLDNDDLLSCAADALRDPEQGLRERYRNRFQLVMVDEFQDTNQMQVDMINLVAGGDEDHLSQRMCVVGDAQQSIYRFRNADLAVFKDYVARVGEAQRRECGRIVHLEQNFRSNGEILALCKGAFENTFGSGQDYLELLHGRDEEAVSRRAPFLGAQGLQEADPRTPRRVNVIALNGGRSAAEARACTARIIARDFRKLRDAGHAPGQMAVLLGGMGHAREYARALHEQGLPCAIAGGSVFNQAPEVSVVEDLCFVLADPFDTQRLVNVLTSPLFGLEAEDLLLLEPVQREEIADAAHGGGGHSESGRRRRAGLSDLFPRLMGATAADTEANVRAYAAQAGWSVRLTACLAALLPAAADTGTQPVSLLIERVLTNSGWLARLTSDDEAAAGNVLKAIRIVRGIEHDLHVDGLSLARCVQERIETLKEAPGVLAASGSDFVRIMTIHASKGLQFPIVAVAETDGGAGQRGKLRTLSEGGNTHIALDAGFTLDRCRKTLADDCLDLLRDNLFAEDEDGSADRRQLVAGLSSPDPAVYWTALNALDAAGDAEEYQRKLYVAYTRAEDCLFVTLSNSSKSGLPEGAPRAIAHLLTGDDAIPFGESAHSLQLFRKDTAYPGHPECAIAWIARLETVNAKASDFEQFMDELSASAADGAPDKRSASAQPADMLCDEDKRHPFAVPRRTMPPRPKSHPYRLQWSEGLLSASALKHADSEEEERPPLQRVPNLEEEHREMPAAAVEKGTAFHSLGEFAAHAWRRTGHITLPPKDRIAAASRLHGLDAAQEEDLRAELERWTASPVARQMEAHACLKAETPFFIPLAEDGETPREGPLTLYGFIDLLAYDAPGTGTAYVVDYKTGRSLATDADRRAAYDIQAKCYAYALLLQGFQRIELDFVFVDQPDPNDPAIPQVTHFPAPGEKQYTREALCAELEQTARAIV